MPAGYLAIVRTVTVTNLDSAPALAECRVADVPIWRRSVPAAGSVAENELRVVGYTAEAIAVYLSPPAMAATVSGYLIQVPAGSSRAPETIQVDEWPELLPT